MPQLNLRPDTTPAELEASVVHLTRAEEKPFADARGYLVFKWGLFAQLIYSDMRIVYTDGVPVAATDSYSIFLNPEGFKDAEITDLLEIAFVLAHEVSHRYLDDLVMATAWQDSGLIQCASGVLPYIHEVMGWAKDYRINAMLVTAGVGKMPKSALYDKDLSEKGMEAAVDIYDVLYRRHVRNGKILTLPPGKSFDAHIRPANPPHDKAKRDGALVSAAQLAERQRQGSVPGPFMRMLDEILNPKIPWEQHLATSMTRKAGEPKLDWRFRNRRLAGRDPSLFFAKRGHKGAGQIVLVGDSSGSINKKMMNTFAAEFRSISDKLNPESLRIFWCDDDIHLDVTIHDLMHMDEIFAEWRQKGVGGGGGTSFKPPFKKLQDEGARPDMVVYFTDGHGTFPQLEPHYHVIWAMTTNVTPPFGEVVRVEIK